MHRERNDYRRTRQRRIKPNINTDVQPESGTFTKSGPKIVKLECREENQGCDYGSSSCNRIAAALISATD